jgi:formate dehydrogenase subunit gamma
MGHSQQRKLAPGDAGPDPAIEAVPRGGPATEAGHARAHEILRFRKTERLVHWAIAIPFLTCFTTAVAMVALQGRIDHPVFRATLSWIHRISGLCLIVLPFAAVFRKKGDLRIHIYNVRQAWIWTLSDVKWLAMVGAAAVSKKVALPEQGKFNAAEKLNFMVLMGTYPFYIATGLTIWLTHNAFLSWVVHLSIALMGTPLVLGHIYMATINPSSRIGLQGMITGFVDRQWARHHYRRWYQEHFEEAETATGSTPGKALVARSAGQLHGTHVLCAACGENFDWPKEASTGAVPAGNPMTCSHCGVAIHHLDPAPAPDKVEAALSGVAARGGATGMLCQALLRCEDAAPRPATSASYIGFPEECAVSIPKEGAASSLKGAADPSQVEAPGKEAGPEGSDAPV